VSVVVRLDWRAVCVIIQTASEVKGMEVYKYVNPEKENET
jgi:hypothetical protein